MSKLGKFVKRTLLHLYWFYKNIKDDLDIQNHTLSPKIKLGKKTMIRRDNEVYNIDLGDFSYISGTGSYIEDAQIGKYCSIIQWWNWVEQKIRENAYLFYNIDKFIANHLNIMDVIA